MAIVPPSTGRPINVAAEDARVAICNEDLAVHITKTSD